MRTSGRIGRRRPRATRVAFAVVALVTTGVVLPLSAAELVIEKVGATSQGFLYVEYQLLDPFEGKALEAIRSGLPSTITYTLEVWRQRRGWWDRLEETRETRVRVLHDLLNDEYTLVSNEGTQHFENLEKLTFAACGPRREYLRPLLDEPTYYVVVTANLAPLSVEDLNELEDWLQGTIRAGERSRRGGLVGLSGTMVGLLLSMSGFGDETTRARTSDFVPRDIRRAGLVTRETADSPAEPP